jgi:hypothetical protein
VFVGGAVEGRFKIKTMNAEFHTRPKWMTAFILILALAWTLPACAPNATPTLFRPPSDVTPLSTAQPVSVSPIIFATLTIPAPTTILPTPPCTDNLTFLNDLTYPDGTVVLPNASMDKQWLVQNSGSCDWDQRYHLRFVGGDLLGAPEELPLYPARVGARVTLRVAFVAPTAAGSYQSAWQAAGPDGTVFGDTVYVLITVAPY